MISSKETAEWGSAILVFASGAMAGHYASLGMTPVQWAGAAAAVLGSVTVAATSRSLKRRVTERPLARAFFVLGGYCAGVTGTRISPPVSRNLRAISSSPAETSASGPWF
jgi:uncharacterized membrane protein YfcA